MQLNKRDFFNLGQLQLAILGAQTWDECAANINYGKKKTPRPQHKYVKELLVILKSLDPDHVRELFKIKCKEKLIDIKEI